MIPNRAKHHIWVFKLKHCAHCSVAEFHGKWLVGLQSRISIFNKSMVHNKIVHIERKQQVWWEMHTKYAIGNGKQTENKVIKKTES